MRIDFPSTMPLHEQLQRLSERKRVGRKHCHKIGPTRAKKQPPNDQTRKAAWRKYREQVALYFQGHRDTMPEKP